MIKQRNLKKEVVKPEDEKIPVLIKKNEVTVDKNRVVVNLASPAVEVESTTESLSEVARVADCFAQKFAKGASAKLDGHKAIN